MIIFEVNRQQNKKCTAEIKKPIVIEQSDYLHLFNQQFNKLSITFVPSL